MPFTVVTGPTISAGQSLSDAVDCRNGTPTRLLFPALWTPANISFQVSYDDGASYFDLFSVQGLEAVMAVRPGAVVVIPVENGLENQFIKIRSGARDFPVVQQASRTFKFVLAT